MLEIPYHFWYYEFTAANFVPVWKFSMLFAIRTMGFRRNFDLCLQGYHEFIENAKLKITVDSMSWYLLFTFLFIMINHFKSGHKKPTYLMQWIFLVYPFDNIVSYAYRPLHSFQNVTVL